MTCRHVHLAGVDAIVCTRNTPPPRVHWCDPKAGLAGIVLCGRNDPKAHTQDPAKVTCKKCLAWIRQGVIGNLTAKWQAGQGS